MESHGGQGVSAESQKNSNPLTAPKDTNFPPVEANTQTLEAGSKRTDCSRKVTKDRCQEKKPEKHHGNKGSRRRSPATPQDDESTSLSDDDSSDNTSSSSDSSSDSESDQISSKRRSRTSKKRVGGRKTVSKRASKHTSARKKKNKVVESTSDSDSSSGLPSSDFDEGDDDISNQKKQGKLGQQFQALQLQVSQLQNQLTQANTLPQVNYTGLNYGQPGGFPGVLGHPATNAAPVPPPIATNGLFTSTSALTPPPPPPFRSNFARGGAHRARLGRFPPPPAYLPPMGESLPKKGNKCRKRVKQGTRAEYKRVDWIWDNSLYTYKLQDTTEMTADSQYNEYIFHVRRTFDCEGKYRQTYVDIKSKLLRECLQDVIGNIKGISLVDETPKLDPNLLFLYLDDFRTHLKHLKQVKPAGEKTKVLRKNQKRLEEKRKQLKVLIKYLNKDYAKTKESLIPMLASGIITFDLLWALWKPNELAYASTYGCSEEPRVFKVEVAERHNNIMKGDHYFVDGKYFEFDGKKFGYGSLSEEINEFRGARKITSLPCYPLKYHKDEAKVREELIARGKKFVSLSGMHYKSHSGMAFLKRKKNLIVKFNIQHSRIMVDPAIFRRINPNYYVSMVRPKDHDIISDDELSDEETNCCCRSGNDSDNPDGKTEKMKYVTKFFKDKKGKVRSMRLTQEDVASDDEGKGKLDSFPAADKSKDLNSSSAEDPSNMEKTGEPALELTDEEYLITSPVVLGFAFSEKQWLEFAVSGIDDISWNDQAWDSLVLEPETKDLIQALVQSRKYSAAQTIDDVIQGKGKGLVTVLHGPPGTGKTLTAEGISELLKCPLYMASAGELGTDSRYLEAELQKILDICHAWGAILLLDEADVFLEKRNMHDLHRNALVSIFLRQLEYFQGILFLTTNRVETFDEAFQSRIHIALRYDALDVKAKKTIFKMFVDRVRALGKLEIKPFTEEDFNLLAKHDLNGREIKNVVGSAQDLAVNKKEPLSMRHIRQVLDVHAKFGRDLRGGTGYEDAMRSYF